MEPITKAVFEKWAQRGNWLLVSEAQAPTGRQQNYLTPSGSVTIIFFDLKGNVHSVGQPVMAPQALPNFLKQR